MSTQSAAVRGWTYEEFARLPDDGNRYEIIAGDVYVTPAPGSIHQKVASRLTGLFEGLEAQGAGVVFPAPYDLIFGDRDYVEPDLIFVRRERVDEVIRDHGAVAAPDLVVEILSGSTASRDRGLKRERYALFGVPEYWLVDVDAQHVEVYRLTRGDLRLTRVVDDVLRYRPALHGPELVIDVPHLLRRVNDHSPRRQID